MMMCMIDKSLCLKDHINLEILHFRESRLCLQLACINTDESPKVLALGDSKQNKPEGIINSNPLVTDSGRLLI